LRKYGAAMKIPAMAANAAQARLAMAGGNVAGLHHTAPESVAAKLNF